MRTTLRANDYPSEPHGVVHSYRPPMSITHASPSQRLASVLRPIICHAEHDTCQQCSIPHLTTWYKLLIRPARITSWASRIGPTTLPLPLAHWQQENALQTTSITKIRGLAISKVKYSSPESHHGATRFVAHARRLATSRRPATRTAIGIATLRMAQTI